MHAMPTCALMFAEAAHGAINQRRSFTNEPYFVHVYEVMEIVSTVPGRTDPMLCAAALHDVVEDTGVTLKMIERYFGSAVAALVDDLTNIARPEDGCRAVRVAINRAHTANASPGAKTIKLADIVSNCQNLVQVSPSFAATYLPEKKSLLEVLTEGDETLYRRATAIVDGGIAKLKGMK